MENTKIHKHVPKINIEEFNAKKLKEMGDLSKYKEVTHNKIIDNRIDANNKQELIKKVIAILEKLPEFEKGMLQLNGHLRIGISPFEL